MTDYRVSVPTFLEAMGDEDQLMVFRSPVGVTLAGVPVLVSADVATGNAWGLDSSQTLVVQRTGTSVVSSKDAAFDYDAVQVRATARVSFGFANPAGVVWLYDAA